MMLSQAQAPRNCAATGQAALDDLLPRGTVRAQLLLRRTGRIEIQTLPIYDRHQPPFGTTAREMLLEMLECGYLPTAELIDALLNADSTTLNAVRACGLAAIKELQGAQPSLPQRKVRALITGLLMRLGDDPAAVLVMADQELGMLPTDLLRVLDVMGGGDGTLARPAITPTWSLPTHYGVSPTPRRCGAAPPAQVSAQFFTVTEREFGLSNEH